MDLHSFFIDRAAVSSPHSLKRWNRVPVCVRPTEGSRKSSMDTRNKPAVCCSCFWGGGLRPYTEDDSVWF